MNFNDQDPISRAVADHERLTALLQQGVREALLRHKRLGESIADWRDGQVVWIPAEEIVVDDESESETR